MQRKNGLALLSRNLRIGCVPFTRAAGRQFSGATSPREVDQVSLGSLGQPAHENGTLPLTLVQQSRSVTYVESCECVGLPSEEPQPLDLRRDLSLIAVPAVSATNIQSLSYRGHFVGGFWPT